MTPSRAGRASSTSDSNVLTRASLLNRTVTDPRHLAPEDAFFAHSPPRRQPGNISHVPSNDDIVSSDIVNGLNHARAGGAARRKRDKDRGRSGSRRRKVAWKKLLWVKQPYPDNYTDPPTFLSHLQRNPRLLPYDFWPLVADSTVIVQHVCSVAIFVCSFVGIFQERVSPVSVVSWGSAGAVLGWALWDFWVGQEEAIKSLRDSTTSGNGSTIPSSASSTVSSTSGTLPIPVKESQAVGLGLTLQAGENTARHGFHSHGSHSHGSHSRSSSATSSHSVTSIPSPPLLNHPNGASTHAAFSYYPPYNAPASPFSPRNQQRLSTLKSAILIYCALLGLSPILKSLTKSTSSDSIWAMSTWLMCIHVFSFDYGGSVGVKFPASLSTNAALMASTVLASRLPSTTHVFSLTLFSIFVFGLFPVFRRHLRHVSWNCHLMLTIILVIGAGAGMGVTLAGRDARWKAALIGVVLWGCGALVAMGGCSWWLIGLQKYKNTISGPWDPARPVIRGGHWD